jgi:hypothetical protein
VLDLVGGADCGGFVPVGAGDGVGVRVADGFADGVAEPLEVHAATARQTPSRKAIVLFMAG